MYRKSRHHKRIWLLAALTVLLLLSIVGVTNAVAPALALEEEPWCEMQEHVHTDACYLNEILICGRRVHTHTENCYPVQLADNDINALLSKIDGTPDKHLRSVIDVTVRTAGQLAAAEEQHVPDETEPEPGITAEQIVRINATVARYAFQPSVILNENLNSPTTAGEGIDEGALLGQLEKDPSTPPKPDTIGDLAIGDKPSTEYNTVNFYIQLDGKTTMLCTKALSVASTGMLYGTRCSLSKADTASAYTSVVETGMTVNNLLKQYYFRYNRKGPSSTFNTSTEESGNDVVFGTSFGLNYAPAYAMLSDSRNNPIAFYTLTMDRSAANEANQVKYVEGSPYAYTLPAPGDGRHWEDEGGNTVTSVTLTGAATVKLKLDRCTVRYLADGSLYAEDTDLRPDEDYTIRVLPDGYRYWATEDGLLYAGGDVITLHGNLTLTALREFDVTFTYLDGTVSTRQVLQGNTVTLPAGYWQDADGTAYAGGSTVTISSDTAFTEVAGPPLTVTYDANWSTPSQMSDPATIPNVVGANTVEVSAGTTMTVSRVSSRVVSTLFRSSSSSSPRYGSVYFSGWQTENGELLQPDSAVSYEELGGYDANGDGVVKLTGVWSYNSLQSVNFFVKLNSAYSEGELGQEYYTPSIFATYLGGVPDGSTMWSLNQNYSIQFTDSTTYLENDKKIRALYGNTSGLWLAQLPPDELIFERLKSYVTSGGQLSVQNDAGEFETVNVDDLNENAYAIRWYVFKVVTDYSIANWHIDGVLIRKEGKVHTTKTFSGNETLIERAKEGFYIHAVNEKQTKRYIMTITPPSEEEKSRILAAHSLTATQITGWLTPIDDGDGNDRTFLWEFGDVDYNEPWTVTEYPPTLENMADYAEWVVVDSSALNQSSSGMGASITVRGITYATDLDNPEWLRVEFNNIYFHANSLMLKKEDAATGRSLAGAVFQFFQNGELMTFDFDAETGLYTYNSHGDGEYSTLTCSGYTNVSTSGFAYDMGDITVREITAPDGYALVGDVTIGYLTDADGNGVRDRDIGITTPVSYADYDRGLLTVENRAAENEVTVFKHWNCQNTEREDIVIQLLANGSANDAADILKSSGQSATQTLTAVYGWSHTWSNVPDYANGVPITWSVREMKIGSEQRKADGTFANWIVSYRTVAYEGGTSLIIENTPKRPMLYLEKVDHVTGVPLRGAEFKLIAVDGDGVPLPGAVEKTAVTDAGGSLSFDNLRYNQRYRLTETIAPEGYFAFDEPAYFTLAEDGTVIVEAHESVFSAGTAFHLRVTDPAGHILPETGGAGASRYYIAGAALLLAAFLPVLYLRKKREEGRTEH